MTAPPPGRYRVLASFGDPTFTVDGVRVGTADPETAPASATAVLEVAGVPTAIAVVSGAGQSAVVGTAFAAPLVVLVTDGLGRPVADAPVRFTSPTAGATTVPGSAVVSTGPDGLAALSVTAGPRAGAVAVVVGVDGTDLSTTATLVDLYRMGRFDRPVVDPAPPSPKPVTATSTVPLKFTLSQLNGRVSDTVGGALAANCRVRVSSTRVGGGAGGTPPGSTDPAFCVAYDASADQFVYNAKGKTLGWAAGTTHDVTVTVRDAVGVVLGTHTVRMTFSQSIPPGRACGPDRDGRRCTPGQKTPGSRNISATRGPARAHLGTACSQVR